MSAKDLIAIIDALNEVLSRSVNYDGELVELTGGLIPAIPDAAMNILLYPDEIPSALFAGYEALSEADVVGFYKNREDPLGFFSAYKYEAPYRLTEDQAIMFTEFADGSSDDPEAIRDIGTILPLLSFQGNYVACDFSDRNKGALLDITYGHDGSFVAPGIAEHLQDLREGLADGSYTVGEDGEAVYPWSSWAQRTGVRSGALEMDEYGDIKKPSSSLFSKIFG